MLIFNNEYQMEAIRNRISQPETELLKDMFECLHIVKLCSICWLKSNRKRNNHYFILDSSDGKRYQICFNSNMKELCFWVISLEPGEELNFQNNTDADRIIFSFYKLYDLAAFDRAIQFIESTPRN